MTQIDRKEYKNRARPDYGPLRTAFIQALKDLGFSSQREFCTSFGKPSYHFANLVKPDSLLTRKKLAYMIFALHKRGARRETLEEIAHLGTCCLVEIARLDGMCSVSKTMVLDWVREEEIYDL